MTHVKILNRPTPPPSTLTLWYNTTDPQPFQWDHQIHYWRLINADKWCDKQGFLTIDGNIDIPNANIIALQPTTTVLERTSEIGVSMGIQTIQFRLLLNDFHYTAYFPNLKHTTPYDRHAKKNELWIKDQLHTYNNWHQLHNAGTH